VDIEKLGIDELKRGYKYEKDISSYICNICDKAYAEGEIFKIEDRFYSAKKAVEIHIEKEHSGVFMSLLNHDSKYNSLTDNQKQLLSLMYMNHSDKEIALRQKVAASTIRSIRFMFREKAKAAKLYLAVYELINEKPIPKEDKIVPIVNSALMIDDRYITTEKEKDNILKNSFSSLEPLTLKVFPAKEKKKIIVLAMIAEKFEKARKYDEKEVNRILKGIYDDFATVRRYLIEYGFMQRTTDCSEYWLK